MAYGLFTWLWGHFVKHENSVSVKKAKFVYGARHYFWCKVVFCVEIIFLSKWPWLKWISSILHNLMYDLPPIVRGVRMQHESIHWSVQLLLISAWGLCLPYLYLSRSDRPLAAMTLIDDRTTDRSLSLSECIHVARGTLCRQVHL